MLGIGVVATLFAAIYRKQLKTHHDEVSERSFPTPIRNGISVSNPSKITLTRNSPLLTRSTLLQILSQIRSKSAPELVNFTQKTLRKFHRSQRRAISDYEDYLQFLNFSVSQEEQLIQKIKYEVLEELYIDKSTFGKAMSRYRHDEDVRRYLHFPEESCQSADLTSFQNIQKHVLNFWRENKGEHYKIARAKLEDTLWREYGVELSDVEVSCENMRWMV